MGMQEGDDAQITVAAADAFGERNPANVQVMPKDRFTDFGSDQTLEPGLMISFQAADGELPGVVTDVYAETVKIDFELGSVRASQNRAQAAHACRSSEEARPK